MMGIAVSVAIIVGAGLGWWGVLAVAMAALAALLIGSQKITFAIAGLVVLAAGVGAWRAANVGVRSVTGAVVALPEIARVVTDPVRDMRHQQFIVEGGLPGVTGEIGNGARTRICVAAEAEPVVRLGDSVMFEGITQAAFDGSMGQRAFLAIRDCQYSGYATSISIVGMVSSPQRALADLRARIEEVLHRSAPGDPGVLLSGLVTGDDEGFSAAREDAFANTATTHLTAVSGSNLALVGGIFAAVGAATVGRHKMAWQIFSMAAIWSYALISGLQAPAIRAAIVTTGAILAFRFGRRPDFVTLIALAAGMMVLVEPRQIEGLGFRLSVAASLALSVVLPAMIERGKLAAVAGIVLATAAAQLATLPFLLPIFGTVSALGLPANVLVAPFVAVAMPIAFFAAAAGLVSPDIGEIIAAPAVLAAKATLGIVDVFGSPNTSIRFGTPPMDASLAIGLTAAVLLLALGGHFAGSSWRGIWMSRTCRWPAAGDVNRAAQGVNHPVPPDEMPTPPIRDGG